MSTLFKGLSEIVGPKFNGAPLDNTRRSHEKVRIGQVVSISMDADSDIYGNDLGIGAILFRFNPYETAKSESELKAIAYPLDRTHYTVPLPGEQVLIYPITIGGFITYAYGQIVQHNLNNTYNVDAFGATQPERVNPDTLNAFLDISLLEKRFEDKLIIPVATYTSVASYHRSLREGDVVVDGRFGSSVLFTSTMEKNIVKSLFTDLTIGKDVLQNSYTTGDGDPVVILQANKRAQLNTGESELVKPSINEDDSSVYLTTTQAIPIKIACSKFMYSWNIDLIKKEPSTTLDPVTFLADFFPDKYDPNDIFTLNLTANFSVGERYDGPIDPSSFKGGTKESNIRLFIQLLQAAGVTNRFTILGALGTIGKESGFIPKNEKGYATTDNARIRKIFGARITKRFPSKEKGDKGDLDLEAFKQNDKDFFDLVYGREATRYLGWETGNTQEGDGYLYRGRGFNQITFKSLYQKYGDKIGQDLVSNPDVLNDPMFAAQAAVKFCINGLKGLKKDPNSFTNLQDAVYYCVRGNHGGGEVRGTEGHIKAQKIAEALSSSGLI